MKYYEVTDKALALEIINNLKDLAKKRTTFVTVAKIYGFSGAQIREPDFFGNLGDTLCRGFIPPSPITQEHKKKFKTTNKGNTIIPKKAFEKEVKEKLNGLEFNELYTMVESWNKLIKFDYYYDEKVGGFVRDGIQGGFHNDDRLFVAISNTREESKLNANALAEIKKSEYLAFAGK